MVKLFPKILASNEKATTTTVLLCVITMVWLPVNRIFNMCTDATAYNFTWTLYKN